MKSSGLLTLIALVPFGCVQGGSQQMPPPAPTASQPPTVAVSTPAATTPEPSAPPAAPKKAEAAKPAPARPAAPPSAPSSPRSTPGSKAPAASEEAAEKTARPEPAAPTRVRLIVPAGTVLPIEIQTGVSTANSREGDPVLAVLTEDVALSGFKLDKGAEVRGRVITAVAAKRVKGRAHLVVGFDAVMENGEKLAIATETIDSLAASTSGQDKKVIAGGAVGGLILGAIKDGKKGAAIGTVIGAAAGTGAVLILKGDEVEIPRGARLSIAVTK